MIFKFNYIQIVPNRQFTLSVDLQCVRNLAYNEDCIIIYCGDYHYEVKRTESNELEVNKLIFAFEHQYENSNDDINPMEMMAGIFEQIASNPQNNSQ
jgi:hypothetical protein